ncbi:hypothetical protein ScPMuIL_000274 [Solemya velum]
MISLSVEKTILVDVYLFHKQDQAALQEKEVMDTTVTKTKKRKAQRIQAAAEYMSNNVTMLSPRQPLAIDNYQSTKVQF